MSGWGASRKIEFSVVFDPNGLPSPFSNVANGTGESPSAVVVRPLVDAAVECGREVVAGLPSVEELALGVEARAVGVEREIG